MRVTIASGFTSDWLSESGASFVNQTGSEGQQNQSKRNITFDTQLKTDLVAMAICKPIKPIFTCISTEIQARGRRKPRTILQPYRTPVRVRT